MCTLRWVLSCFTSSFFVRQPFNCFRPINGNQICIVTTVNAKIQNETKASHQNEEKKHTKKSNEIANMLRTKCILHKNNIISICFLRLLLIAAVTHSLVPFPFHMAGHSVRIAIRMAHAWIRVRTDTKLTHCVCVCHILFICLSLPLPLP